MEPEQIDPAGAVERVQLPLKQRRDIVQIRRDPPEPAERNEPQPVLAVDPVPQTEWQCEHQQQGGTDEKMRDCGSHVSYCAGRPANILVVLQSGLDFAAGTLN